VSLHRSEGFGLGIAEAMFLGKPVVATSYSGNTDFMSGDNSCPVGYRMRPITMADHRLFPSAAHVYQPGLPWAEPDVDQAARWMRTLADQPGLRARLGLRAAQTMRERYSSARVGELMVERLEHAMTRAVPVG